jgi:hypothetical protein
MKSDTNVISPEVIPKPVILISYTTGARTCEVGVKLAPLPKSDEHSNSDKRAILMNIHNTNDSKKGEINIVVIIRDTENS